MKEKLLIQERIASDIKIYRISFDWHSEEYDFFDSGSVIDCFLTNFPSGFVPIKNGMVKIKCSFSVISMQRPKEARFLQKTFLSVSLKKLFQEESFNFSYLAKRGYKCFNTTEKKSEVRRIE